MGTRSEEDLLDLEILDGVAGLFARLVAEGEELAKAFGIPAFVMKAMHMPHRSPQSMHSRAQSGMCPRQASAQ